MPINIIIGNHDVKPIKPAPNPIIRAVELMNTSIEKTISFGDRVIDIKTSNAAGIESIACFWGTKERNNLIHSNYDHAIIKPEEIITLIR